MLDINDKPGEQTLDQVFIILKKAFQQILDDGIISRSPCLDILIPNSIKPLD